MSETESNPENKVAPDWYVPTADRNSPAPRRFQLRPLTGLEQFDVRLDKDDTGRNYFSSRSARALLRYGLVDWENVPAGKFTPGDLDANVDKLEFTVLHELVNEIFARSFLSGPDRKN